MKSLFLLTTFALMSIPAWSADNTAAEIDEAFDGIAKRFHVPGMAIVVTEDNERIYEHYYGLADLEQSIPVDRDTEFPVASLTKTFSAIALFKAVEEGKLDLDVPVNSILPEQGLPSSVTLRHVLTHTSQGENPGQHFYYSVRFSMLSQILQRIYQQPFETIVREQVLEPMGLQRMYALNEDNRKRTQSSQFARPYMFDGEVQPGEVEFGLSAAAGLVGSSNDLIKFANQIGNSYVLSENSWHELMTPIDESLPYAHGIFRQHLFGEQVYWGYAQYDAYAGLMMVTPNRKLSAIFLMNNNLLSDSARLINGSLEFSPLALEFFARFVLPPDRTEFKQEITRSRLLSQALTSSFLAMYDGAQTRQCIDALTTLFEEFPNVTDYTSTSLLHTLGILKTIFEYREGRNFQQFDNYLLAVAESLLKRDPDSPYTHIILGDYYRLAGDSETAREHYQQVAYAQNFAENWYTDEAKQRLEE